MPMFLGHVWGRILIIVIDQSKSSYFPLWKSTMTCSLLQVQTQFPNIVNVNFIQIISYMQLYCCWWSCYKLNILGLMVVSFLVIPKESICLVNITSQFNIRELTTITNSMGASLTQYVNRWGPI